MITTPATAASPPTDTSSELPAASTLTSSDFMQILVAEFQNQDPTTPVDPTEFASQLVDFSNLGQLQNIDAAVQQTPQTTLQSASSLIGREVVAAGNSVGVKSGAATSIVYSPTTSDSYTALVSDANGNQVANVSLGDLQAGSLQTFTWTPPSSTPDGTYTVNIINSNNASVQGLLEQGRVQNVSLSGSNVELDLGNLVLSQSAVQEVAQP
ncbi:MAG TPA: flagellar hook capping FlgD N-terminal domain-containing protein [Candidatus Binataceae bacterium]|nr:flagellar hook capping FlgD N-terminal domain-containing protein [Candidatus Binataceae bacterium]